MGRLGERGRRGDARAALVRLGRSPADVATPLASKTGRNLIRAGVARVALGATRDVVLIDGTLEVIALGTEPELEEAHAQATEFDPRTLADEYVYLRLTPQRIQAWREVNELAGRYLMRDGAWVV